MQKIKRNTQVGAPHSFFTHTPIIFSLGHYFPGSGTTPSLASRKPPRIRAAAGGAPFQCTPHHLHPWARHHGTPIHFQGARPTSQGRCSPHDVRRASPPWSANVEHLPHAPQAHDMSRIPLDPEHWWQAPALEIRGMLPPSRTRSSP